MRAVLQLFFLVFYLFSSYVTTQHRLTYFGGKLQNSKPDSDDTSLKDSSKQRIRYTHFREAKKVGADILFGSEAAPEFFPLVSSRDFTPQNVFFRPQFHVDKSHSRAPPIQTR
jgi:hypothetical protein